MDTRDAGRLGGLKGGRTMGASKVRGNSDHYRAIRAQRRTVLRATINHSTQRRRIVIRLEREGDGYLWRGPSGEDAGLGVAATVNAAKQQAVSAWGAPEWDLRAAWLR